MLTSVEIENFRGIKAGKIDNLTPLVVLVGPNGAGKSSVIEALLIGASPVTAEAIVQVVRRHEAGGSGIRWLLWNGGEAEQTQIRVQNSTGEYRQCQLRLLRGTPEGQTRILFVIADNGSQRGGGEVFGIKNKLHSHNPAGFLPINGLRDVYLAEGYQTSFQRPLHELLTKAVQLGRRSQAREIIKEVFPEVTNVEILTENEAPIVHLVFEKYSVPANLAGDGIQSLLRLGLELAASTGGVALLEEPEVHQHPGAVRQSARAIFAAVRRDIQVILTTHSLELVDALLANANGESDLAKLSAYRLQLKEGVLTSSRLPGSEVAFARSTIEDDLR